jgi:NCAIR mutase (PurE)-related protein
MRVNPADVLELFQAVRDGRVAPDEAARRFRRGPIEETAAARLDVHREARTGIPEVVFAPGKADDELVDIVDRLIERVGAALVTRLEPERAAVLTRRHPGGRYHPRARVLAIRRSPVEPAAGGSVAVVTAGTADAGVAEEAAVVLEHLGRGVDRLYDVGVAGLHRLLGIADRIEAATVAIVVAGMEGALPTVVGGLTDRPIVAVPTSVGYGVGAGGVAALLAMLNSCSGGVTVVNIDNGFGAAAAAHRICGAVARRGAAPDAAAGGAP